MQELEEQALREESKRCHDFLSRLSSHPASCSSTPQGESGYLLPCLVGAITSVISICSTCQGTLEEEQPPTAASPMPVPKQSPWPKRWLPLPEPQGSTSIDETTPRAMQKGPSSPKRWEAPTWFTSLKPSHAEAFLWDSSTVKEARSCFFSNLSYNFVSDGNSDLSDVFKELAKSTSLLGEAIYKIQLSWTRPEELKQAN